MNPVEQAAVARLAQYRLENNLTYQQLSDEMAARDLYLPARSLHLALTHRVVPIERTRWRIQRYVSELPMVSPSRKKAKRRTRRAA